MRPPKIIIQPAPQELIIPGKSASFTITATGYKLSYQWWKDGTDIPGANSHTYSIDDVAERYEGEYSCVVSNDADSVSSTPVNLTLCKYFSLVSVLCYSVVIIIKIYYGIASMVFYNTRSLNTSGVDTYSQVISIGVSTIDHRGKGGGRWQSSQPC